MTTTATHWQRRATIGGRVMADGGFQGHDGDNAPVRGLRGDSARDEGRVEPEAKAAVAVVAGLPAAPDVSAALRYIMAWHGLLDWAPTGLVPRREHIAGLKVRRRGPGLPYPKV